MVSRFYRRVIDRIVFAVSKRSYLQRRWRRGYDRPIDFDAPRSFNEKLNAYKVDSYPNELMPRLVDKIEVKEFVSQRIGNDFIIPTLWSGPNLPSRGDRDWPRPFVLKSSHGSGQNIFVHDEPDWPTIEHEVADWLRHRHGRYAFEWPYLKLQPRLLVEPYINVSRELPLDYKFFVFDGVVKMIQVDTGRGKKHYRSFMSLDWQQLPFDYGKPRGPAPSPPTELREMLLIASKLAEGLPFVRVDLYNIEHRVLFGELTFFPDAGLGPFDPREADEQIGAYWEYRREQVERLKARSN